MIDRHFIGFFCTWCAYDALCNTQGTSGSKKLNWPDAQISEHRYNCNIYYQGTQSQFQVVPTTLYR